jgi:regulator of sigma E protease
LFYVIGYTVVGLKVAIGLGFVIFVHELGHFLVAKLCGVKCEKFYLGFDIAGLKFCKFRWGETEYGIGILPLGGYVKMLGQEDNPAKLREEMERAKAAASEESDAAEVKSEAAKPAVSSNQQPPIGSQQPVYDPRSFLAMSVPRRMAIISAGVIMNVIFAFVMAVVAFGIGVKQTPCVLGETFPGLPAWQADLRPGDKILKIAGKEMKHFRDLQTAIALGDIDKSKGVEIELERPGVEKPFVVTVKPDNSLGAFFIGVAPARTTRLLENRPTWLIQKRPPVVAGSAASRTRLQFHNDDEIVRIDDVPISNYGQINRELARKADEKITVVVRRAIVDGHGKPTGKTEEIPITVDRSPMRQMGLVMKMDEVVAIQAGSPAVAAGIEPGDVIIKPAGDPMKLEDELLHSAGKTIDVTLKRKGEKSPRTVQAKVREPIEYSPPEVIDSPVGVSALGVAYHILNEVDRVIEGSPAAKAGMRPGDRITKFTLIPPDPAELEKLEVEQKEVSVDLTDTKFSWPSLISALQEVAPGTTVELTFFRQKKEQKAKLDVADATDWFNPDRGFLFEPMTFEPKMESIGDAFALGGKETLDNLTIVFRSVKALGTNRVSPRNLLGPWGLIKMALFKADQGNAELLLFLTFLSANLAVINFLPIPVLDGGHFVLLCYEGIRGKPANEYVQTVLAYIGLALIIALMVWVMGLDLSIISRH